MASSLNRLRLPAIVAAVAALINCSEPSTIQMPHHTDDGFRNSADDYEANGFSDFLRWQWQRWGKTIPSADSYDFPVAENDPAALRANQSTTTLTWVGHATFLLQVHGYNILTDPHFSRRASPVQWAGPERVVAPGIALEDLPRIDAVVISHNHYDSLDTTSVRRLHQRPGGQGTRFFVPLGLKGWFRDLGVDKVEELDWWQSSALGELQFTATPAQHWSKRGLFGSNQSLWCGWVIKAPGAQVYFAGDSGYAPLFKHIGRRLGPFDLALLPIGAYAPRWFMGRHHMSPEEAVQVHEDVGARQSVAMHWGTFVLTDEPLDEPPRRLAEALVEHGIPEDRFQALRHGRSIAPLNGHWRPWPRSATGAAPDGDQQPHSAQTGADEAEYAQERKAAVATADGGDDG